MQPRLQHQQAQAATPAATITPTIDPLLRLPAVESAAALKRSAIYDGVRKGTFPKTVRIGGQAVAWRQSDVAAWINSRVEAA